MNGTALRPTNLFIDLKALSNNYRALQKFSFPFLCPMVKANAYGHGDVEVSQQLESLGSRYFGVGLVEEGARLRAQGIKSEILVFGFYGDQAIREMERWHLTPVLSNFAQCEALNRLGKGITKVHIKINSGMNRLGFSLQECQKLLIWLQANPKVQVEGIATHFFSGEEFLKQPDSSGDRQLKVFEEAIRLFKKKPKFLHVYNSSALSAHIKCRKKLIYGARPGLILYGVDPVDLPNVQPLVSPVMEFRSKIVGLQEVKSGEVVSYGGLWQAPRDSVIGIVPAGYADGVPRSLSQVGSFLALGQKVAIRGLVCMDYVMVDLTDIVSKTDDLYGLDVVLFGKSSGVTQSLASVAECAQITSYELMTGMSERVPRVYQE